MCTNGCCFQRLTFTTLVLISAVSCSRSLAQADAQFTGEAANDQAGGSVSGAGDVNGDGFDDLLVGAGDNSEGGEWTGAAYLVLGSATPTSLGLAAADAKFTGEILDGFAGSSVAGGGDVDGDGFDDMLVGSAWSHGEREGPGSVFLILGSPSPASIGLESADACVDAPEMGGVLSGPASAFLGDVNADGFDDLGFGFGDSAFLVLGAADPQSGSLASADAIFSGGPAAIPGGTKLVRAGDYDGDGLNDVLVVSPSNEEGGANAGCAWLIEGATGLGSVALSDVSVQFLGRRGDAVMVGAGGEDVNGDGFDDLVLGAPGNSDAAAGAGAAFLLLGESAPQAVDLGDGGIKFTGGAAGEYGGQAVAMAGDYDGDGFADFVIGAPGHGGEFAGGGFLVTGTADPVSESLSEAGILWVGAMESDYAGSAVAGAGDVNGDGLGDVLIGAPDNYAGGHRAGTAYLLAGQSLSKSGLP